MKTHLVSVIIPTYNCGKYIKDAIESVFSQTYKNFEIIVIDDGSTDDTENNINGYVDRITYFKQPHRGAASARNEGLKRAKGDFIAFLDADDVWEKEKLEKQIRYFEEHPEVGMVYTDLYRIDMRTNRMLHRWSEVFPVKEGFLFKDLIERNFIQTSTTLIKKEVIECIGFFDETFKAYEDIDYWVRIAEKFKIGYIPEPLVKYRMFSGTLSQKTFWMVEGRLKVFEKHASKIEDEKWKRKVLADIYSEFMIAHYLFNDMKRAREYFYKAIKEDIKVIFRGRTMETFLKTLLGEKMVKFLREIKRGKPQRLCLRFLKISNIH